MQCTLVLVFLIFCITTYFYKLISLNRIQNHWVLRAVTEMWFHSLLVLFTVQLNACVRDGMKFLIPKYSDKEE